MRTSSIALIFLVLLAGCGAGSPTSPSEPTPNEVFVTEKAHAYATALGIRFELRVQFHESKRNGAEAWASVDGVHFWSEFVERTDRLSLQFTVAHEVCHVAGIRDEDAASECARGLM